MRDTSQIGISHYFLPRIASFQSIPHSFWGISHSISLPFT
jgi:hypothetical protein